jgi:hypothetical protein
MKLPGIVASTLLTAGALTLAGCVTQDNQLIKTVPVGSGTSRLKPLPFVACVKSKWGVRPLKIGEYSPNVDGDVLTVHGTDGKTILLVDAEPSANGTGYTIYGDTLAANAYVVDAHGCD